MPLSLTISQCLGNSRKLALKGFAEEKRLFRGVGTNIVSHA